MSDRAILICYDGSEEAKRAIDEGARILGPRHAVVTDVAPLVTQAESLALLAPSAPAREFEELNQQGADTRAEEGAQHARAVGFTATARGVLGVPTWEAVLDVADEVDAEVILLGSRGIAGVRALLEQSVSHAVAQHSGRSLLIVPPSHRRA
jgi:nucleotide-binding universal stress UspA family protein